MAMSLTRSPALRTIARGCMGLAALAIACWVVVRGFWAIPFVLGEPLCDAAGKSDLEGMTDLLNKGADPNFLFDGTTSPLDFAMDNKNAKAVAILLHYGADTKLVSTQHGRWLNDPKFVSRVKQASSDLKKRGILH